MPPEERSNLFIADACELAAKAKLAGDEPPAVFRKLREFGMTEDEAKFVTMETFGLGPKPAALPDISLWLMIAGGIMIALGVAANVVSAARAASDPEYGGPRIYLTGVFFGCVSLAVGYFRWLAPDKKS